jgi:small conductance mechanosensitive channel
MNTHCIQSILLILALAATPAFAQSNKSNPETNNTSAIAQEEGAEKDPLLLTGDKLLKKIRAEIANTETLKVQQQSASQQDSLALARRIASQQIDALSTLAELSKTVLKLEQQDIDSGIYRSTAQTLLSKAEQQILIIIDDIESTPVSERHQAGISQIPLNTLYQSFQSQLESMRSLGMDVSSNEVAFRTRVAARADRLAGRLELFSESIEKLERDLKLEPDNIELQSALIDARDSMKDGSTAMSLTIRLMESLELDPSRYQQLLIQSSGELTTDILNTRVMAGLIDSWAQQAITLVRENGATVVFRIIVFLLITLLFWMLSRLTRKVVTRSLASSRYQASALLKSMLIDMSSRLVIILGLLTALSQVGISLGPVLAGLGVAGFIVGFALQDTLSNFASGMMILIYRPFDNGDLIEAAGVFGKVESMSLVSTTILTIDNQTLVVPNSKIWGDVIKNLTHQSLRRVDMEFGIGYGDSMQKAETVLLGIVNDHASILADPPPIVKVHRLNESSVDFIVRPWVKTDDYWDVYWDITRSVKERFDEENISIPFPQRDVHVHNA